MSTTAIDQAFHHKFFYKGFVFSAISLILRNSRAFHSVSTLFAKTEDCFVQRFYEFTNCIFYGLPTQFRKFCMLNFVVALDVTLFVQTNAITADEANRLPKMLLKEVVLSHIFLKASTLRINLHAFSHHYVQLLNELLIV